MPNLSRFIKSIDYCLLNTDYFFKEITSVRDHLRYGLINQAFFHVFSLRR